MNTTTMLQRLSAANARQEPSTGLTRPEERDIPDEPALVPENMPQALKDCLKTFNPDWQPGL